MSCHPYFKPGTCKGPIPEPGTSLQKLVRLYQKSCGQNLQDQLEGFRKLPSIKEVINRAARAVDDQNKRYSHQRRLNSASLIEAERRMIIKLDSIESCLSFDSLYSLLSGLFTPVHGLGPLYIYDTALRLGAKRRLYPTVVYLHAGTRKGARALGLDVSSSFIEVADFPKPIQILAPQEIEDFLCIFKEHLAGFQATHVSSKLIQS